MTENMVKLYSGKPEDFRWAGFGSGSGTNLRECAKVIKPALIFSDRPKAKLLQLDQLVDVPKMVMNGFEACGSWKAAAGNPEAEAEYFKRSLEYNHQIVQALHDFEENEGPLHLIVLGGYMRLVGEPLLRAYSDKIINVHPADLSLLAISGKESGFERRLVGENAVYDALNQGETKTKSSVIMVDGGVDHGEILTMGPAVSVWHEFTRGTAEERNECLKEYAGAHQSFQKVRSDWPALTTALKMISEGSIALGTEKNWYNEWRTVYVDGKAMGYEGFQVQKDSGSKIMINTCTDLDQ